MREKLMLERMARREKVQNPREKAAAITIQRMWRGKLARKSFMQLRDAKKNQLKPKDLKAKEAALRRLAIEEQTRIERSLKPKSEQLMIAVDENDYLEVVRLFEDADVTADALGNIQNDEHMQRNKCDVNFREPILGETPLVLAAKKGYCNLVKVTIEETEVCGVLFPFSICPTVFAPTSRNSQRSV